MNTAKNRKESIDRLWDFLRTDVDADVQFHVDLRAALDELSWIESQVDYEYAIMRKPFGLSSREEILADYWGGKEEREQELWNITKFMHIDHANWYRLVRRLKTGPIEEVSVD